MIRKVVRIEVEYDDQGNCEASFFYSDKNNEPFIALEYERDSVTYSRMVLIEEAIDDLNSHFKNHGT